MEYAVVALPAAPVRRKPDHRKEMTNQLLFGETVRVLRAEGERWVKIRSLHDGYEGWTTRTLLAETDKTFAHTRSRYTSTSLLGLLRAGDQSLHIPAGASLPGWDGARGRLGELAYEFTGDYCNRDEQVPGPGLLEELTSPWLNAPYCWGGRTPLGVDCSGLVQVIYKQMGFDLPRDAWQQAQEGKPVKKFSESKAGDLAFFDNREEIVHVGILLGDDKIIHASGKVRIDTITKKGIINAETGKKTNPLRALRRLW